MKLTSPRPIYLEGHREEAILLLHSFTGTIRDVKPLAHCINKVLLVTHQIIEGMVTAY